MKKCANPYKAYLDYESEFGHRFCCWAANHMGWAKMKKANKRIAKRRMKQDLKKQLQYEHEERIV